MTLRRISTLILLAMPLAGCATPGTWPWENAFWVSPPPPLPQPASEMQGGAARPYQPTQRPAYAPPGAASGPSGGGITREKL